MFRFLSKTYWIYDRRILNGKFQILDFIVNYSYSKNVTTYKQVNKGAKRNKGSKGSKRSKRTKGSKGSKGTKGSKGS